MVHCPVSGPHRGGHRPFAIGPVASKRPHAVPSGAWAVPRAPPARTVRAARAAMRLVRAASLAREWGPGVGLPGLRSVLQDGAGGGGSGAQKFVYQKWPDQIVPFANFIFPHDGHFGLGGGVRGGRGSGLLLSRGGGEGGRGFWTQNLGCQKWPDQIFRIVNLFFSHYGHFGLGRGGGGFGGGHPPLGF